MKKLEVKRSTLVSFIIQKCLKVVNFGIIVLLFFLSISLARKHRGKNF